jgi:hypothetical protein
MNKSFIPIALCTPQLKITMQNSKRNTCLHEEVCQHNRIQSTAACQKKPVTRIPASVAIPVMLEIIW